MYEVFKFDRLLSDQIIKERFDLSLADPNPMLNVFTEAYFTDGKKTMEPIVKAFQNLKDLLDLSIKEKKAKFHPKEFVRSLKFKELEDALHAAFGFRNIEIYCSNELYDAKHDTFEINSLNCYTYPSWRFPIEGLVTDKGFYDKSRSINTSVTITLGLLRKLSAEECVGVLLHEIGHNLDPALVDINYVATNVYSKYLTDRQGKITDKEKKALENETTGIIEILAILGVGIIAVIAQCIANAIGRAMFDKEKAIAAIKQRLRKDGRFSRQTNQEAFADNFARMYGFGPALVSASNKIDKYYEKRRNSRFKKEKDRQRAIANIVQASIGDVHKTDVHRIHSLIREYEADLKDPTIPERVKKDIREDLEEVKKVLESYLKDRTEFENRVNQLILDELERADINFEKKKSAEEKVTEEKLRELVKENADDPAEMMSAMIFEGD